VLPAAHRLTDAASFRDAARRGRRASARTVTVHLRPPSDGGASPVRVGFVVSKAVGGSVVRTRVKRRLRHLVRDRLASLPTGSTLVVRAAPAAAEASSAELARDLDRCLARALEPRPEREAAR
jgi:ribonuclease P protein component